MTRRRLLANLVQDAQECHGGPCANCSLSRSALCLPVLTLVGGFSGSAPAFKVWVGGGACKRGCVLVHGITNVPHERYLQTPHRWESLQPSTFISVMKAKVNETHWKNVLLRQVHFLRFTNRGRGGCKHGGGPPGLVLVCAPPPPPCRTTFHVCCYGSPHQGGPY